MRFTSTATVIIAVGFFSLCAGNAGGEGKIGSAIFERNDRLLTWQTNNSGLFILKPNLKCTLESALSTSVNLTTGTDMRNRWYDKVYNKAQLEYDYSDKINVRMNMGEDWNRDTMNRLGNTLLTTNYGGVVRYKPSPDWNLAGKAGQMYDRRFDYRDTGTTVAGELHYSGAPLSGMKNLNAQMDVNGGTSNLKRTNDVSQFRGALTYENPLADVGLELRGNRSKRGYLSDVDRKNIEERESADQELILTLQRGIIENILAAPAFAFRMNLGNRRIDDTANNRRQSSKFMTNSKGGIREFEVRYGRTLGRYLSALLETGYSKDESNVEQIIRSRNQTDVYTRGTFGIVLGKLDSLEVIGWIKRTRIDTPPGVANNRDELKIESGAKYKRRLTENLKTALDFRVLETHYVNIDVSQSSQNKWMKTYQLSPSLVYAPLPSVEIRHEVGLYASYIDFDFDSDSMPRSTITRRVSSETWIEGAVSSKTRFTAGVMFEDNDYGRLTTRDFRIPAEDGIRRFADISVEYEFAPWMIFVPHYIYAIRKDYSVVLNTVERREIDQTYGLDISLFDSRRQSGHDCIIGLKRVVRGTTKEPPQIRNYISMTLKYGF
ncbi:MAG: hypothetical protein Q8O92_11775 [Candidatus Latescibacter sp.]|nr:hypothetical protein [Candidatus Latescibacter sp.]